LPDHRLSVVQPTSSTTLREPNELAEGLLGTNLTGSTGAVLVDSARGGYLGINKHPHGRAQPFGQQLDAGNFLISRSGYGWLDSLRRETSAQGQ
jgi:hypothetical protein